MLCVRYTPRPRIAEEYPGQLLHSCGNRDCGNVENCGVWSPVLQSLFHAECFRATFCVIDGHAIVVTVSDEMRPDSG